MNESFVEHLDRLKVGLDSVFNLSQMAGWIEQNTYLDGRRFNFRDHEFQRDIINDSALTSIVIKCAQVGLSEICARWTLAAAATQDNFTAIYTFPTTNDAEKFCKTRIDPCVQASPALAESINKALDNSEIKQFGKNSFIYFRGTLSETAALSVPADAIIHDEVDKSNLTQMSVYVSRLQHRPTKMRKLFSTPTVNKYGISKEAETAKRHRQVLRCSHCNYQFLPDYFNNVVIPGYDKDKREITKANLKDIRWQEARLLCPHCGKVPDPDAVFRQWVVENPNDDYPANAWYVTPFSAPNVISAPYLVKNSTEYDKFSEFMNQALGLTAEDAEDSITVEDLEKALLQADLRDSSTHLMGCDMGLLCHITIGRVASNGELLVVHREVVPYTRFEERRRQLCGEYKVSISVHDSQPYVDLIDRITKHDPNAYGSIFTTGTPSVMFSIMEQDEDAQEGKMSMRRVKITRTMLFDNLMAELKAGMIKVQADDKQDDLWKSQMRSLKRVGKFDRMGELVYSWEKTDGHDHFHFSLAYLSLAAKMRGLVSGHYQQGSVPLVSKFRVKAN